MEKEYKVKPLRPNWHYKRGDVYLVNLNPCKGSEQGGIRPAVVVQNDSGNYHSPVLIVVLLTTKIKKELLPTHHLVRSRCLREASMALCEAMRPVDKQRILGYIGKLSQADMRSITSCLQTGLGLRSVRNALAMWKLPARNCGSLNRICSNGRRSCVMPGSGKKAQIPLSYSSQVLLCGNVFCAHCGNRLTLT